MKHENVSKMFYTCAVFSGNLTCDSRPISRQHAAFMLTRLLLNAGGECTSMHYADACLPIHYLRCFSYRFPCEKGNLPVTAHLLFWHDFGLCSLCVSAKRVHVDKTLQNKRSLRCSLAGYCSDKHFRQMRISDIRVYCFELQPRSCSPEISLAVFSFFLSFFFFFL
jgi:hypothetical protein